jgi:hypothetical protein
MGDAPQDARTVLNAIRMGHVYSTIDAVGGRGVMTFTARSGEQQVVAGDSLPFTGPVTLSVETQAPADARIVLMKEGTMITSAQGTALQHVAAEPGVYRVEVELPGSPGDPPVPWMLSNPIYVGRKATSAGPVDTRPNAREFANLYENGPASNWAVESSSGSLGAIDSVPAVSRGMELRLRYALSGMASMGPYVAFVTPAGPMISNYSRLMFTARADHPLRMSVQLRVPRQEQGERWHRSVYLDTTPRTVTVYFDDLTPRGSTSERRPPLSEVQAILFVVDTVNTSVGTNGQIWMDDVKYGR